MIPIYLYFMYAGALPFIGYALCLLFNITDLPLLGSVERVLSVYSLVIATFLAGSLWGLHLPLENKWHHRLPIVSNVIAVVLWLTFLLAPMKVFLILVGLVFAGLLVIDDQLRKRKLISAHYFSMRCIITAIVLLSLIISGLS